MADNELKIKIDLVTTGRAQANEAGESLKRLKIDTSDLSDETKRNLGMLPPLEDGLKKEAKAAEESGISHRELRHGLMEIGNVAAPGAGRALSELAMGPLGAALALVGAYESVRSSLEAASEAADRLAEELAKPETGGIQAVQKAWDDAATAYGEYLDKISSAGKDKDPIKTEVDRAKELVLARLEAQKKIQEAMGDQAGAAYTQGSIERTKGTSSLLLEQGMRERAQPELAQQADAASLAAIAADKKFRDDQAKLAADREATDPNSAAGKALADKIKAASEAAEAAKALPDQINNIGGPATDFRAQKAKAIADAEANLAAANQELANRRKEQATLEGNEALRQASKTEADSDAKNAAEAATANRGRLVQLPGEIGQAQKVADINEHSQKVLSILETHGGRLNETLQQLANSLGFTHEATLNMVNRIVAGQDTFAGRMANLERMLERLEAQQGHASNLHISG